MPRIRNAECCEYCRHYKEKYDDGYEDVFGTWVCKLTGKERSPTKVCDAFLNKRKSGIKVLAEKFAEKCSD
jgi:hypothetical protein